MLENGIFDIDCGAVCWTVACVCADCDTEVNAIVVVVERDATVEN